MNNVEAKKRTDLVRFLESQLGEVEYPAGSNRVKYNDWYYEKKSGYYVNSKPYAWCGTFVAYSLHFSGIYIDKLLYDGLMYVPKAKNILTSRDKKTDTPQPGDIVIFDWNADGFTEHIGFYLGVDSNKRIITIEGNTSSDVAGDQSNGGMVCKKRRHIKHIQGFYNIF